MVPEVPLEEDGINGQSAKDGEATIVKATSVLCQTQSFLKKWNGELK